MSIEIKQNLYYNYIYKIINIITIGELNINEKKVTY